MTKAEIETWLELLPHSNRCYSFSHYRAILVESGKKKERKKIDDLPVLATCQFGTLVILSSQVNGPIAVMTDMVQGSC